jgi:hypothetical protein
MGTGITIFGTLLIIPYNLRIAMLIAATSLPNRFDTSVSAALPISKTSQPIIV